LLTTCGAASTSGLLLKAGSPADTTVDAFVHTPTLGTDVLQGDSRLRSLDWRGSVPNYEAASQANLPSLEVLRVPLPPGIRALRVPNLVCLVGRNLWTVFTETQTQAADLEFQSGAGDENRTRALSLGSCGQLRPFRALTWVNSQAGTFSSAVAFTVVPAVACSIWCACGVAPDE
jgi:hypothetical protein